MHLIEDPTSAAPASPLLYRMIYCSVSHSPIDDALCQNILQLARPHNMQRGITGLLLASDTLFVQFLEGPREAVRALFKRIQRDPRHKCVVELMREADVTDRLYADWSMGYGKASRTELMNIVHEAKRRIDMGTPTPWAAAVGMLTVLLDDEVAPHYAQAILRRSA
jgi:hypothetical protein